MRGDALKAAHLHLKTVTHGEKQALAQYQAGAAGPEKRSRPRREATEEERASGGEVATIFAAWLLSMNLTSKWPGKQ